MHIAVVKQFRRKLHDANNLAQLLNHIGVIGVIELPELLSDKHKANDVLQEQKPNNIPQTENTQQENESYESSESEDEADESERKKGANDAEEDETDGPSEAERAP